MATKAAHKRLSKEFVSMQREPPPFVWATPEEKNILTWNFLIRGPPDSAFAGGEYHGVLLFPSEYPFKPPGIKMYTPSGRFHPDKKICFSMSDFHPGTWNPAWSVATILTGLLSFMLSDEMTTGSVTSSDAHKRVFATRSHAWNLTQKKFRDAFPDYCTPTMRELPNMGSPPPSTPSSSDDITPHGPPQSAAAALSTATTTTSPSNHPLNTSRATATGSTGQPPLRRGANGGPADQTLSSSSTSNNGKVPAATGACVTWGLFSWDKWRWGALILLAVMVSRFSSSS